MPLLVLDPGHGGRDPGACGRNLKEKDVTLRVCLFLRDALERNGFRVLLTRDKDTERVPGVAAGVDLKARAMLANTNGADLYISWHCDASNKPDVNGAAVWIHPSQQDKPAYHKAELIAERLTESSGQKNRGVYYGDYQVLRDTMMDAVLIEGGFITNPAEESLLGSGLFLYKQAEGVAQALCRIYGIPYVEGDASAVPKLERAVEEVKIKVSGLDQERQGRLIDGKTYVPVRDLAELFGCAVTWDGQTQTVTLTRGRGTGHERAGA